MGLELKEALRSLCLNNGWSYAVCWRVKSQDSILLIWEDAYYEEHIGILVEKLLHQVHIVGEGIIGKVAFTGKHKWIFSDAYCGETSPMGPLENQVVLQDTAEWHRQFLAGIKTVAIISVSPQIVVQFGSTQKILERLEFVNLAKSLFHGMQSAQGNFLCEKSLKAFNTETYDSCATFASVLPSYTSNSNYWIMKFLDDNSCKEHTSKARYSTFPTQLSSSYVGLLHRSLPPHGLAVSVPHSSTFAAKDSTELLQKTTFMTNSSPSLINQCQNFSTDCQVLLSTPCVKMPHVLQQSRTSSTSTSAFSNSSMTTWRSDISSLTAVEQGLLSGLKMLRSASTLPPISDTNYLCGNMFHKSQENSILTPLYNNNRTLDILHCTGYEAGKLADIQQTSPLFHVAEDSPFLPQLPKEPASSVHNFCEAFGPTSATSDRSNPSLVNNFCQWTASPVQQVNDGLITPSNDDLLQILGVTPLSSAFVGGDIIRGFHNSPDFKTDPLSAFKGKEKSLNVPMQPTVEKDLLDGLRVESRQNQGQECFDDIILPVESENPSNLSTGIPEYVSELDEGSKTHYKKGVVPDVGLKQLLDAVVSNVNLVSNHNSDDQMSTTTATRTDSTSVCSNQAPLVGYISRSMDAMLSICNSHGSQNEVLSKSLVNSWIDDNYRLKAVCVGVSQTNRSGESIKLTKKRARPGKSTRPRPKDRQQIRERVKELREIVPNGTKCSIDALLDRTIKHMLFLQSLTKYADKLKQIDKPKVTGKESGVALKDTSSSSGSSAARAFEVGGQAMVCPILVEDLNSPGQMLVGMLCEERGFFLEMADIIRGFGLTILKGVMEVRDDKIWARFVVEANRDVTKLDIFLSLVKLLQETSSISSGSQQNKVVDSSVPVFHDYQQSPMPVPISLDDRLQ